MPGRATTDAFDVALGWLPMIGVFAALAGTAVRAGSAPLIGAVPSAVLCVAATILLTGAYHEDGLADTADGLWGGWTRETRLAAMRDSRLGTYGVVAVTLDVALRVALVAPLNGSETLRALMAAHVMGRATAVPLRTWLPDARPDDSAPRAFKAGVATWVVAGSTAAAAVALAVGTVAIAAAAAATVSAGAVGMLARRRIGGATGDVLGAAIQVSTLAVLMTVIAAWRLS